MKRIFLAMAAILASSAATAAEPSLQVTVNGINAKGVILKQYAQCIATSDGKSTKGENLRPSIAWNGAPEKTKSLAVIVSDPDVPADLSIANNPELLIAGDMKRQVFYHWIQFNIAPDVTAIPGGDKPPGFGRSAANDVTEDKLNYGGPCPPWNDAEPHHYHFTVHALDVAKLPLAEGAPAKEAVALIEKHSIAHGETVGTYTLNPELRKGSKL